MNVRLISYSKPVIEGLDTPTDLVAFCARVSNPSNQFNSETAEKLIKYLIKHQHWSPLELCNVVLEIETTRDIARQILRHRSFSFQEFCVSGDTEIYFAVPGKIKSGSYKPTQKFTIKDLWDKWENGSAPSLNGIRMPMKDRIKNMMIKVYDEKSGKLTTSNIKEMFKTGKKDIFEITLSDGKKIKTTKEHKFLTAEGFVDLETAVGLTMVGDRATMTKSLMIGVNGELEYQNKDWLQKVKNESLFVGGGIPYICEKYGYNYNTIRKWLRAHGIQFTKTESATTFDVWNKGKYGYSLPPKTLEAKRNHQKSAKKGSESNLWRGGGSSNRKGIDTIAASLFRESKNYTCENCKAYGGKIDIHHKIPVSVDPSLEQDQSNWQLLCRDCHIEHHKEKDWSGWQAMGAKSKKEKSYVVKWVSVDKVEYVGQEETYDIEVEHSSHNYVANGIIVHNSQRYADPTKDLSFVTREARLQDPKNRQNSVAVDDALLQKRWEDKQNLVIQHARDAYAWAIEHGIAKEQARAVLPEGLTMSRMYMNGTLRSWIHYIQLRSANGTQKEHMDIARECAKVIAEVFPLSNEFVKED